MARDRGRAFRLVGHVDLARATGAKQPKSSLPPRFWPERNAPMTRAVAVTFGEEGFDANGDYLNAQAAKSIFSEIATFMTGQPLPH